MFSKFDEVRRMKFDHDDLLIDALTLMLCFGFSFFILWSVSPMPSDHQGGSSGGSGAGMSW